MSEEMQLRRAMPAGKPLSVDEDARSVELIWSTGAITERYGKLPTGGYGQYLEELDMSPDAVDLTRLNAGAPLLNSHSSHTLSDQIGVVERAWLDGGRAMARVRFSERAEVEPIWNDVKSGVIRNVSVGYWPEKTRDVTGPGDRVPRVLVTRWRPGEISLVPVPADPGAQVRSASVSLQPAAVELAHMESRAMADEAMDVSAGDQSVDQVIETRAAKPKKPDPRVAVEAAVTAERTRTAGITKLTQRHGLTALGAELIEDGSTIDAARARVLEELAATADRTAISSHVRVASAGPDEREKWLQGMQDWLHVRSAQSATISQQTGRKLEPGEFRGLTLMDAARDSLARAGISTRGMDPMKIAGMALRVGGPASTQGTGDFSVLLENTMNKTLLASYNLQPLSWRSWARQSSVTDFRANPRYKTGLLSNLQLVRENGEFQYAAIPDGVKESVTATTKGLLISVSRQTIINDDMDALSRMPADLGRAAAVTVESDIIALLVSNSSTGPTMNEDSTVMFHSNHANIGTSAAPSVASFDEARTLMAKQRDISLKDYIDVRPAVWLGPIGLLSTAQLINSNTYDPTASTAFERRNIAQGMFSTVVGTPRLTGTRWYAFADPNIAPAFEVAFLNGKSEPFLDMEEGFTIDGTTWKVRLDYGVGAPDWRPAVTNAGA
jgi:hypothetical protein